MILLLCSITAPLFFGLLLLAMRRGFIPLAVLVASLNLVISVWISLAGDLKFVYKVNAPAIDLVLMNSRLSSFILSAIAFFTLCVVIYSAGFLKGREGRAAYWGNVLLALGAGNGVVLAGDLISLLVFWGFSALTLYNLINCGGPKAATVSKKAFILVGGCDALMILGVALLFYLTKTFEISGMSVSLTGTLPVVAYLCFAVPAFAKLGAMPLHGWVPDSSAVSPTPVMALLPASLDKLLGIYLLARLSLGIFTVQTYSFISLFLLTAGSLTVIFAVFSALLQHDLKKLLSFHAVSQVGYMMLGIGTGSAIGIAGALFHMVNNAIYKSCLFFCAGSVEKEAGTTDLASLGGLSRVMPITFFSMAVAALSISGIPPLNGFFSKWMIYQSLVSLSSAGGSLWIFFLAAAMFGSALTLASFMKVLNAVFFGAARSPVKVSEETPPLMWIPSLLLSFVCIVFGVFANQVPLKYFILPAVPAFSYSGAWASISATLFLIAGLFIGGAIYLLGRFAPLKKSPVFIGGEDLPGERMAQSGVRFYDTIRDIGPVRWLYDRAVRKTFDVYEGLSKITFFFSDILGWLHNGLLHTYLAWCLLGLVVLIAVLFR